MDDNPYRPPDSTPQYYADDVVLLPVSAIWRAARRLPIVTGLLVFVYFLIRKMLRLRHHAIHAKHRPDTLQPIDEQTVPDHVHKALEPYLSEIDSREVRLVGWFRDQSIGGKLGVNSIWLDASGRMTCSIAWLEMEFQGIRQTKATLGCQSRLTSGGVLVTAALAPEDWIPEIFPPSYDFMVLPEDAKAKDVIDQHLHRIEHRDDVVAYDEHTIRNELLRAAQELFDFVVAEGILAPISVEETRRLMAVEITFQPPERSP